MPSPPGHTNFKKALIVGLAVILVLIVGFWILNRRPTRNFTATLMCKQLQSPVPLRIVVHHSGQTLALWNYSGSIQGVDAVSIKQLALPKNSQRRITLHFDRVDKQKDWLQISRKDEATVSKDNLLIGTELEISTPPNTRISMDAPDVAAAHERESAAQIKTVQTSGSSVISWQLDRPFNLSGSRIREFANTNSQSPIDASPLKDSFVQLEFSAQSQSESLTSFLWSSKGVTFTAEKPTRSVSVSLEDCSNGQVAFGTPVTLTNTKKVDFDNADINTFEIKTSFVETPQLAITIAGSTSSVRLDGTNKNPTTLEDLLGPNPGRTGLVGLLFLLVLWILKTSGSKAFDVIWKKEFPESKAADNGKSDQNRSPQ